MSARIRYTKQPNRENCMISVQKFTSNSTGAKYKVVLDFNDNTFKIRNERTKEFIYKSKSYGNINVLKRNARKRLEKLGVSLDRAARDRTFGVCKKGYTQEEHETDRGVK